MTIWLDVTTLLRWEGRPVGIIRVESELARSLLYESRAKYKFCRYDLNAKLFFSVPDNLVKDALSVQAQPSRSAELINIPHQENALVGLSRLIKRGMSKSYKVIKTLTSRAGTLRSYSSPTAVQVGPEEAITWSNKDTYISVGLDWDDKDLRVLFDLKVEAGLQIVLCCYDMIPILYPEFCVDTTRERFPDYILNLARCADTIICISQSTQHDLSSYLRRNNLPNPPLKVVHLGTEMPSRKSSVETCCPEVRDIIKKGSFIMIVSTIEPRKGHEILYNAYQHLHALNQKNIPLLIFAGRIGWGSDSLIKRLNEDQGIGNKIRILETLSDHDLAVLYEHCLFTVFPSVYEGWGLPVSESLSRGKFCIASNSSSIPEAGGEFCDYIDSRDSIKWAHALLNYINNPALIISRENFIRDRYIHIPWQQTANQIIGIAESIHPKNSP